MDIVDSTKTFTISLTALPLASIEDLSYPSTAKSGEEITISFTLFNRGTAYGTLFAKMTYDTSTTELWRGPLAINGSKLITTKLIMPNKDLSVTIEAGHEE